MVAPSREAAWKTAYRLIVSRSYSASRRGELSVGRAADPRRIAEARHPHFGTHSLPLSARPPTKSVTNLAYLLREPRRSLGIRLAAEGRRASGDDIVVNASGVSLRPTQLSINGSCVSARGAVDCDVPRRSMFLGMRLRQDHLQDRTGAFNSTGRDPPSPPWLQRMASGHGCACSTCSTDGTAR